MGTEEFGFWVVQRAVWLTESCWMCCRNIEAVQESCDLRGAALRLPDSADLRHG
jgi:hypothetical protein